MNIEVLARANGSSIGVRMWGANTFISGYQVASKVASKVEADFLQCPDLTFHSQTSADFLLAIFTSHTPKITEKCANFATLDEFGKGSRSRLYRSYFIRIYFDFQEDAGGRYQGVSTEADVLPLNYSRSLFSTT